MTDADSLEAIHIEPCPLGVLECEREHDEANVHDLAPRVVALRKALRKISLATTDAASALTAGVALDEDDEANK